MESLYRVRYISEDRMNIRAIQKSQEEVYLTLKAVVHNMESTAITVDMIVDTSQWAHAHKMYEPEKSMPCYISIKVSVIRRDELIRQNNICLYDITLSDIGETLG